MHTPEGSRPPEWACSRWEIWGVWPAGGWHPPSSWPLCFSCSCYSSTEPGHHCGPPQHPCLSLDWWRTLWGNPKDPPRHKERHNFCKLQGKYNFWNLFWWNFALNHDSFFPLFLSLLFFLSLFSLSLFRSLFLPHTKSTFKYCTYQFFDASMLPDSASGSPELGHIGDGFGSQTLEILVGVTQDLHHCL